jgi:hypothetical protein
VGRARSELHIGLAKDRLDAQDRPGVALYGRVLVVHLDRSQRAVAAVLGRNDLAYVDPRDPHLGGGGQLLRVREGNLEPVALAVNGVVPPNSIQRNSNSPMHDSANSTIVMTLPSDGELVSI